MTANNAAKLQPRPHLVTAALSAFVFSFIAARTFTTFFPSTVLITSGIHIHHFWYGIVLLAVGGWIGISYNNKETDQLGAVLYGAGGGLIVDEVGLLLTFGNYWTSLTYTFLTIILAFVGVLLIISRYRQIIEADLFDFLRSRFGLHLGVFLLAISIAFTTETSNLVVTVTSITLTAVSIILIIFHIFQRFKKYSKRSSNRTE
jgi:hypothetical protein